MLQIVLLSKRGNPPRGFSCRYKSWNL